MPYLTARRYTQNYCLSLFAVSKTWNKKARRVFTTRRSFQARCSFIKRPGDRPSFGMWNLSVVPLVQKHSQVMTLALVSCQSHATVQCGSHAARDLRTSGSPNFPKCFYRADLLLNRPTNFVVEFVITFYSEFHKPSVEQSIA